MNFLERLFQQLDTAGSTPVLSEVTPQGTTPCSGAALLTKVAIARHTLRSLGLSAGQRVAFVMPNSIGWVATDLAILAEGAIAVPLYARQAPEELAFMIEDCDASLIIVDDSLLAERLTELCTGRKVVSLMVILQGQATSMEAHNSPVPQRVDAPLHGWSDEDIATLIYTSGTSGNPKGVMTTIGNLTFMLPVTSTALDGLMTTVSGEERVFHYLPFCFAGSRIVLWTCLLRGSHLHMSTNLDHLIDEIGVAAPHYFLNVPVLLERVKTGAEKALRDKGTVLWGLYKAARKAFAKGLEGTMNPLDRAALALADRLMFRKIAAKMGPNIQFLICGSAPLGEDTQHWFAMLGIPVYQVYGLTETTAIVTMDTPGKNDPGQVGSAIGGVEMKLGDGDELLIKGPNTFHGYWNRPEASAEAYDGPWFRTGDQCEIDAQGRLKVVGRVKNLLVPSSGHNVPPEPIEQKLMENITGAEQVVLIGHARPYLTALVTGDVQAAEVDAALGKVNAGLPHYKRVRQYHHRLAPLTPEEGLLTANGKLKRKQITAHFAAEIEGMYS